MRAYIERKDNNDKKYRKQDKAGRGNTIGFAVGLSRGGYKSL